MIFATSAILSRTKAKNHTFSECVFQCVFECCFLLTLAHMMMWFVVSTYVHCIVYSLKIQVVLYIVKGEKIERE